MKKQRIEKWEYILDSEEMEEVIKAFKYVRHRILEHNSKGAKTISLKRIENILRDVCFEPQKEICEIELIESDN